MTRKLIATVLSAALIATSFTTAPARADEDVAKVLGGLVVLGLIAKAIDDRNDRKRKATGHVTYPPVAKPHRPHRPVKVAPRECLRETWTHRGYRDVYSARCLKRHSRVQLPQSCLRQNHTNSGPRFFYTPYCLRKQGWRV